MALTYLGTKTYTLAGTGGVAPIDLVTPTRTLTLKIDDSGGEAWVRVAYFQNPTLAYAAAAPANSTSPVPASNALSAAGWVHLKGAGSSYTLPTRDGCFRFAEVYDVAAGGLQVVTE